MPDPDPQSDHDTGPTDDVFKHGWVPKGKTAPASPADVQRQKLEGGRESAQAADAAVVALAGRLDAAATRVLKLVTAPDDAAGPGLRVNVIEQELDHLGRAHDFLHVQKIVANQKVGSNALSLLASSEARLKAAVERAETYAKSNAQDLDGSPMNMVHTGIHDILDTQKVKAGQLPTNVQASTESASDLAVLAIHEQLEAALARVQLLRMGIDVAQPSELHAAIEEYTAHMKAAQRAAGVILVDRKKPGAPKASRATTARVKKLMKKLADEVQQLLVATKGNPNVKAQTKWVDVSATLAGTMPKVMGL